VANQQKVQVNIFNEPYTFVVAEGQAAHMEEIAALVDKRMRDVVSSGLTVDSRKVAILAAINIAQDLCKMRAEHDRLDQKLAERSAECADLLDQVLKNPLRS
jgi:cell division protein ZapA